MKEDTKFDSQFNEKDFQKTIYTFKAQEIAKLAPWDADIQKAEIAKQVITSIIRNECFKRVGAKNSPDIGIKYDVINEQFTLFIPRNWCSMCQNRRAEYSVQNKIYCTSCVEILKSKQPKAPEKKQEAKKESKASIEQKEDIK